MFGYVIVNKQELRFREFDRYRSYYCGLCSDLKKRYGRAGQISLSYDLTFVILLLTALYEPEETEGLVKCIAHPFEKHPTRINRFTEYAADMNLLLTYEKCRDDWQDEKKLSGKLYSDILTKRVKQIREKYPKKAERIDACLKEIGELEKKREINIDLPAGAFGNIMAELFAVYPDEWERELRNIGFYLGKFIYIMDAYDDLEKDEKSGSYNPLLLRNEYQRKREAAGFLDENHDGYDDHLIEDVEAMLVMMMGECGKAFERLPLVGGDVEILRNILYSGVWCRFGMIREKRSGHPENNGENR
ncbi:MAG: hypothetical protein IJT16_03770 [Lachnospiraceae bacterium]|nr:hypothetical protein [Lachnospiraceae bacterium]